MLYVLRVNYSEKIKHNYLIMPINCLLTYPVQYILSILLTRVIYRFFLSMLLHPAVCLCFFFLQPVVLHQRREYQDRSRHVLQLPQHTQPDTVYPQVRIWSSQYHNVETEKQCKIIKLITVSKAEKQTSCFWGVFIQLLVWNTKLIFKPSVTKA